MRYLALGWSICNLFQPDVLCIGGGVSNEEDEALLHPLQRIVNRNVSGMIRTARPKWSKGGLGNEPLG